MAKNSEHPRELETLTGADSKVGKKAKDLLWESSIPADQAAAIVISHLKESHPHAIPQDLKDKSPEEVAQVIEDYIVLAVETFPGEIQPSTLLSLIRIIGYTHDLLDMYRKSSDILDASLLIARPVPERITFAFESTRFIGRTSDTR